MEKIIGILGGMGPEATADLYLKIIRATGATRDQDHLRVLIDSNAKIPDRTAAILHGGEDPLPLLTATARNLERAGAGLIIIPCNTAHYFHRHIQDAVSIHVIHMPQETAKHIATRMAGATQVGLLATTGTLRSRIYADACQQCGLVGLEPEDEVQLLVMDAIYGKEGIKAGGKDLPKRQILEAAKHLIAKGAQVIVAGCTEIPLVLQQEDLPIPVIDPTQVLAETAIRRAQGIED